MTDPKVIHWIENVLRPKLNDPEFCRLHIAVLAVGLRAGQPLAKAFAVATASAVADAAKMDVDHSGRVTNQDSN